MDGWKFKIETSTGGKVESTETMMFEKGMVKNDVCIQYGFAKVAYSLDDQGNFRFSLFSENEDKMD